MQTFKKYKELWWRIKSELVGVIWPDHLPSSLKPFILGGRG
jgi:hypothetical protein